MAQRDIQTEILSYLAEHGRTDAPTLVAALRFRPGSGKPGKSSNPNVFQVMEAAGLIQWEGSMRDGGYVAREA